MWPLLQYGELLLFSLFFNMDLGLDRKELPILLQVTFTFVNFLLGDPNIILTLEQ